MIAVVMRHDNGWFSHRLLLGPRVVLQDLFGELWSGWRTLDRQHEVIDGEHIDGYTVMFERYEDPVEHQLLAELDTSAAVYADWLDEHGRPTFAEMLRLQLEAPQHHSLSDRYRQIDDRLAELAKVLPEGWRHFATRPLVILGDELQFRIGSNRDGQMRTVQIWAGTCHLTPFDDAAYVPQFAHSVSRDREALVNAIEMPPTSLRLFSHGPTTDDMQCTAQFDGEDCILAIEVIVYPRNFLGRADSLPRTQLSIRMRTQALVELFDDVIGALTS